MKRKLVKQGAATLMVSLPSKWARKFNLGKGDEIDMLEKGNEIIINVQEKAEIKKAKINLSELKHIWRRVISALYKAGYDEIEINFSKPDEISKIYLILNEFIGFEIISQTEKGCVIKEVVETKETNFNTMLNRTLEMLLSVANDCSNALKGKNTEMLGTIPGRDMIINKYANFCRRIINKGLAEEAEAPMLYYVIECLEALGDVYKDFSKYISETKIIPSQNLIRLFDSVKDSIENLASMITKFELSRTIEYTEKWKKTRQEIDALMLSKSSAESRVTSYLHEMMSQLENIVGPLLILNSAKI